MCKFALADCHISGSADAVDVLPFLKAGTEMMKYAFGKGRLVL